jgi:hypothetical protein
MAGNATWQLVNPAKAKKSAKYQHSGILSLTGAVCVEEASFYDYVKGGLQINVIVGIDFTASNGNPSYASSLHYMSPYNPVQTISCLFVVSFCEFVKFVPSNNQHQNEYQKTLYAVMNVLEPYDSDKLIPLFGFGVIDVCQVRRLFVNDFQISIDEKSPNAAAIGHASLHGAEWQRKQCGGVWCGRRHGRLHQVLAALHALWPHRINIESCFRLVHSHRFSSLT